MDGEASSASLPLLAQPLAICTCSASAVDRAAELPAVGEGVGVEALMLLLLLLLLLVLPFSAPPPAAHAAAAATSALGGA